MLTNCKSSKLDFRKGRKIPICSECGGSVSLYLASKEVVAVRPEASRSDYWIACDEPSCINNYGDYMFQEEPDWVIWQQPDDCPGIL
ncbi:hypothetical protein [Aliiroseovarius zhejiangensis]